MRLAVNRARREPSRREELLPAGSTLVPPRQQRRAVRLRLLAAGCSISGREEEATIRTRDGRFVRSGGRSGDPKGGQSVYSRSGSHITILASLSPFEKYTHSCFLLSSRRVLHDFESNQSELGSCQLSHRLSLDRHSATGRMAPRGASSLGAPPAAAMAAPAVSVALRSLAPTSHRRKRCSRRTNRRRS